MELTHFEYLFSELDSDESISRLAESLGTTSIDNTIQVPAAYGNGTIRKIHLEPGLQLRAWNFKMNLPLSIKKIPDVLAKEKTFHVVFLLNPDVVLLKSNGLQKNIRLQREMNIIFVSGDIDIAADIEMQEPLQIVDISFTSSWLMQAFDDASEALQLFIVKLEERRSPVLSFTNATADEYRMISKLHDWSLHNKEKLHIKPAVFSFLSSFFQQVFIQSKGEFIKKPFLYPDLMMKVEKYLIEHLEDKFPGIDVIAKKVALSESTLKRHFKMMFGKNINEYYQELKMDHAKRLILEQPLTINEIASRLHYQKTNNFINMFKKFHEISPGALRKKSQKILVSL